MRIYLVGAALMALYCLHPIAALPFGIFKKYAHADKSILHDLLKISHTEENTSIDKKKAEIVLLGGGIGQIISQTIAAEDLLTVLTDPQAVQGRPKRRNSISSTDALSNFAQLVDNEIAAKITDILSVIPVSEILTAVQDAAFLSVVELILQPFTPPVVQAFVSSIRDRIDNTIALKELGIDAILNTLPETSFVEAVELNTMLTGLIGGELAPEQALTRLISSNIFSEDIIQLIPRLDLTALGASLGMRSVQLFIDLIALALDPFFSIIPVIPTAAPVTTTTTGVTVARSVEVASSSASIKPDAPFSTCIRGLRGNNCSDGQRVRDIIATAVQKLTSLAL